MSARLRRKLTRRQLLSALPAATAVALAGCTVAARPPDLPPVTLPPAAQIAPVPFTPTPAPAPAATATATVEAGPQRAATIVSLASWGSPPEMRALRDGLRGLRRALPDLDVVARLDNALSPDLTRAGLRDRAAADVVRVAPEDVFDFTTAGYVLPLDEPLARDIEPAEFDPAFRQARPGPGGEVGAISLGAAYLAVYYNASHIETAGVDVPTRWDQTWSVKEFEAAARRLVIADEDRVDRFGLSAVPWFSRPVLADASGGRLDGKFFGADGRTSTMASDRHVRALRRLAAWQTVQEFELGVPSRFTAPFNGGLVSMYIDASDFAPAIRPTVRWGIAPLPAWTGNEALTEGQELCLAVNGATRAPEAAWRVASYFLGAEAQRALARHDAVVPFRLETLGDPAFIDPNRRPRDRSVWATASARDLHTPANPAAKAWHVLTDARINDVRNGTTEAQAYLESADRVLTRQLRIRDWSSAHDVIGYRQPIPFGNALLARLPVAGSSE